MWSLNIAEPYEDSEDQIFNASLFFRGMLFVDPKSIYSQRRETRRQWISSKTIFATVTAQLISAFDFAT